MNDFQHRFMKNVESAHSVNLSLVERYKEDSFKVVDDLYREIAELQHTKVHLNELLDKSRLQLFFDGAESRFNTGLKKYTLEFTSDVKENYRSYDKKLKNLFIEEGVSGKDIYSYIESNGDEEYSAFMAKADNIHIEISVLNDVQSHISNKAEKVIKKFKLLKTFFGIIIPLILVVLVVAGLKMTADKSMKIMEEGTANLVSSIGGETAQTVTNSLTNMFKETATEAIKTTAMPFIIGTIIILGTLWLIYYTILAYVMKRKMIRKLEKVMATIHLEFSSQKPKFQDAYATWLTAHLNEMNNKYFLRYKPLIDMVITQEGR